MEKQKKFFIFMTKPFVLFVLLFALGVGSVWGYSFNYPHLYFYNSGTEWTNEANKVMFFYYYHRDDGDKKQASQGFNMLKVDHTKLWYVCATENRGGSLSGFSYGFGATSDWPWEEGDNWSTRWGYMCDHYNHSGTSQTNLPYGTYLCTSSGADNLVVTQIGNDTEVHEPLNHTQTVKKYTRGDGEGSYTAASVNSGTVSISAYQMTGSGTASNEDNSDEINTAGDTEASADAAYTGEVTVTASANTGYVFMGWYSSENGGSEDKLSSSSSYTYNAPNSTKTVYARFAEKLPVSKTLYLATNAKWRENSARFAAVFCNASTQQWVNCSAVAGTDDMYSVSIPDGNWGCVIFCKMKNSSDEERVNKWDNRWCQTDDMYKNGLNNCVYITGDCSNSQRWGKYAQIPAIVGGMNNWDPVANQFSGSPLRLTMDFSAGQAYQFKLASGRDDYWYGHGASNNNDLTFAGQTNAETLTQGHRNMMFLTAKAGTYTFEWDATNSKLTIIYPDTLHPSMDYVYMEKYSGWNSGNFSNIHYWDDSSTPLTDGGDDPKMTAYHNFKDKSLNYYIYPMLSDYPNFKAADGLNGGTGSNHTDNMVATGHGGHYVWHNGSGWVWATFQVYIKLENQGADEGKKGTLGVPVAFNDTALSTRINKPSKTYYDFGGYYTAPKGGGLQIIDANGDWKTNVSDYTSSGAWIHAGDTTTLYAYWTEHPYNITLAVDPSSSPAGGSIQIGGVTQTSVNAYYVSETAEITAVPSNAAWRFKEWRFSQTGEDYDVYVSPGHEYSSTSNPITIKAKHDGTLTAVFEPRFYLVGVLYSTGEAGGGMPGWESGSEYRAPFEVTSNSPLTATCTRRLNPNTAFMFLVRNRDNGLSYGYATSGTHIKEGDALLMNTADGHVYLDSKGHGDYTFTISSVTLTDGVYYPTVSVSGPTSYKLELKRAYVKVNGDWYKDVDDAGGTVSAQTTESGQHFAITDGQYVAEGGSITYTATPTTPGFTFRGWYNNNYNYQISTSSPYVSSNIRALEHFEGKFTEDTIDVTIANDDHGYVQIGESTVTAAKVGVITTREITAVPHPGYMFSHWEVPDGKNFTVASTTNATTTLSGLTSGSNGTLTAHFKPRYLLRGSLNNDDPGNEAGMPGWSTTGGLEFTGTTFVEPSGTDPIPVDLRCTCTLHPNKAYKFSVHDSVVNRNYGYATNLTDISSESLLLNTENYNVLLYTAGYGTYVFQITYLSHDGNYYPTVKMLSRQASRTLTLGVNNGSYGSVSAQTNEGGGGGFAITNGQYYATGSDITFTASPNTGYYVEGWYSDAECTTPYDGDASDVTIGSDNLTLTLSSISTNKTVYAKFAKIWSVYMNSEHTYWSIYAKTDGDDIYTFNIDLPANTQYTFTIHDNGAGSVYKKDNTQIYYMTYGNSSNWDGFATDKTKECGIKTAGKGTYTFTWNATDKVLSVIYPDSYTVTFGYGTGGSAVTATVDEVAITSGQYVTSGKDITFTKTAATGYTFKGWYDAVSGGSAIYCMASDDVFDDIDADTSIYAQFTPNTYTIAYDANDGQYYGSATGSTTSSSHTYDAAKNLTSNGFSRTGFDFAGWNTAADGSGSSYTNGQSVTNLSSTQDATVTLYAIWTAHELTITLDDNGGSGGSPSSLTAVYGRTAVADGGGEFAGITNPTRAGYSFGGWWTNTDGTGTEIITSAHYYCWKTDYVDDNGRWKHDGDVTAYAKWTPVALTFTNNSGSGDGKWSTASNWSPACVPTIDHDVVITKPVTVDIAHATAKSIVLDQNSKTGKLTIQANKGLEVVGTVTRTTDGSNRLATRAEDLVLESSASGNASLIFNNSNECKATVQMYSIGDIDGDTWNWQFMGTPFTSANALYSYYGSYLYEWKAGGYWDAVANGGTMTPFTGYCITQDEPTTYVMDGTLNPTTSKTLAVPEGVEMVFANSWSAPIDVGSFTNETFGIDEKTVYLFNTGYTPENPAEEGTGAGTYIAVPIYSSPWTGHELIAPMQGFYVDNKSGSAGSITMNYATVVRPSGSRDDRDITAGAMHAPKRVAAEAEPAVMKIKATGSRYSERIVILEREDFSTGFDNGWDGKNINEPGVAPIIYTLREDGTKDAVSAIPTYEGTVVGFRIGEDNNYTFSFNYDGEDIWYLNDLKEEKSTLIDAANTYSFVAEAGDAEARFIISATPIQKLPTGIGNDANDANDAMVKVRKLIINDQLFIIRAGRMYNAVGSIVK